jgi:hypothetical protein
MSQESAPLDTRYYGKFRGSVVNNLDPSRIGRIQVSVPDVGIKTSSWALPCLPTTGSGCGVFTVPTVGAAVWVEFEQGDPDHPIWVGGFWGSSSETPSSASTTTPGVDVLIMQTQLGVTFSISDAPGPAGGISIKTAAGASISVNDVGITLTNGKGAEISLTGPSVDLNKGALKVT